MDSEGIGLKRRGAKRKRKDVLSVETDGDVKRRSIETSFKALLGSYVSKDVEGTDIILGRVVECAKGEYRVIYLDGSCEYMGHRKVRRTLIRDNAFDKKLDAMRNELDKLILNKCANENTTKLGNAVAGAKSLSQSVSSNCGTCTKACKCAHKVSSVVPPPPVLPPSTGNIGVPEECAADLLCVYTFLRSFSIPLCLSPFGLNDFVGSLICSVQNTLLDSIHVALMHCLQRHFEALKSDGSELALKYLRSMDWSMIDLLTWPISIVQYLMISKCSEGKRWKEFYFNALRKEYYALSVCSKLMALRKLCDDALDSAEIRAEIDMHNALKVITNKEVVDASKGRPRRNHHRSPKTSVCYDQEDIIDDDERKTQSSTNSNSSDYESTGADHDGNDYECRLCGMDGKLLCCDGCPLVYHSWCVGVSKRSMPEGEWYCPECTTKRIDPRISKEMCQRGAECFGVDPYEQVFLGTCNHLLVIKILSDTDICIRYYHQNDIQRVLHTLHSSVQHNTMYAGLCEAIQQYWKISMDDQSIIETPTKSESKMEDGECLAPSYVFLGKKSFDVSQLPENEKVACSITDFDSVNMADSLEKSKGTKEQAFGLTSQQVDPCYLAHLNLGENLKLIQYASCTSKNISSSDTIDIPKYTGTPLKDQPYINHYTRGDYAASAASAFVQLKDLSAEYKSSELHFKISLQEKAFSSATIWYFWPDPENKLVEGPREKCGWCLNCKADLSKRGCLLNAAASNAIRATMKKNSAICLTKDRERSLYGIVTYMLNLEESLHSLTFGPFRSPIYRKMWRKQVEQALTSSQIKSLLLQLEKNICLIAFKREWIKLVDECSVESAVSQNTANVVGSSHKRGPGGRRGRKQGNIPVVTTDNDQDRSKHFIWWRGGIVSKLVFHRGMLPCSMAKKSARQGQSRKIPSVSYVEGVEIPKRTQRFVWRAAVEMSMNISQLAMQIRYLDSQVRWGDLVRPTKENLDGKGSDAQASLYRNAFICDKRYMESQSQYAVDFRSQKHLPLRITKNAEEEEKNEAGKQIYWILETNLPLYLIKEYEDNMEKVPSQPAKKAVNELSELQKRQLKDSRKDIFSFLLRRRDNLEICRCASCHLDVLIGNAVKCARCKGYCHTQCMVSSTPNMNKEVKFLETCKVCYDIDVVAIEENHDVANTSCLQVKVTQNALTVTNNTPTSSQTENPQNTPTVCKGGNIRDSSVMHQALNHSFEKPTRKGSNAKAESRSRACSWGLVWKKKGFNGTGIDFRLKRILLKGNPNPSDVRCDLCKKAYNKDLMYISCETCNKWYHADALELDESRLLELTGFKCCKCRRIKSPVCPYTEPVEKPASQGRNLRKSAPKQGSLGVDDQRLSIEGATPYSSLSRVEDPQVDMNSLPGSGNIFVGRHLMQNNNMVCLPEYNFSVDLSANIAENSLLLAAESCKGLNLSGNDLDEGVMSDNEALNREDMEFDPRNYVSRDPPVRAVQCQMCSLAEPGPDLCCEICRQWMHRHCSPVEESSGQWPWRCISCREWQ
ncbi:hypothetical protein DCAR_0521448 [Daucus carota subsp. sativus]|uniref:PHD-type domain-containing protein n=2 Tax=Daucus carota subsp. sativus TaxID=79200 RepID=A0AAF1B107_DAUCS|nr:hypothetical protein DCAR_0521448 [Daucus carota subsp. sativus]